MKTCNTEIMEEYIDIFMGFFPKMLKEHEGEWTVIGKDREPLGFFETSGEAFYAGAMRYGRLSMLVRQVSKEYLEHGKYGEPVIFHSRVSF